MQASKIAVKCDESSGQVNIIHENNTFLSNIDLVLYYDENWISCDSGELIFERITKEDVASLEGMHLPGSTRLYSKHYRFTAGNESFSCELQLIHLQETSAIYITGKLHGFPGKFNGICGFIECGIPRAGGYRLFHTSGWQRPVTASTESSRLGVSLFDPSQNSWENPAYSDVLPDREELPITYMLAKMDGDAMAAFVPVNCDGQVTTIRCCQFLDFQHGVKFVSGTFMKDGTYTSLAGGLIAFGNDPVVLTKDAFTLYMTLVGNTRAMRPCKRYPEAFEYMGFCTWNTFYNAVDIQGIRDLAEENFKAKAGSDRFKYLIVDDGWQSVNGMSMTGDDEGPPGLSKKVDRGLRRFEANCKFPKDIGEVVDLVKSKYGFKWVGVWHAVTGYWPGVEPDSYLGRKYPITLLRHQGIPDPDGMKGYGFWRDYYAHLRQQGIDLLKIDNQSSVGRVFEGYKPLDDVIADYYDMQQGAAYSQHLDILNCMCMPSYCYIKWHVSNVSRVTDDFYPGRFPAVSNQAKQSTFNPLYYGLFCYPDHDMFFTKPAPNGCPTSHLFYIHAIGGGPIYVADEIGETDANVVSKLCFPDGRIPRLDGIGMPTADIIFKDTDTEAPCKMWNYHDVPGWGRVFYVFVSNMLKDEKEMVASTSLVDCGASALQSMQPAGKYAFHDRESGRVEIKGWTERLDVSLPHFGSMYFCASPVINGIALLGMKEVYNGTKGIRKATRIGNRAVEVEITYPGTFEFHVDDPTRVIVKNMDGSEAKIVHSLACKNLVAVEVETPFTIRV